MPSLDLAFRHSVHDMPTVGIDDIDDSAPVAVTQPELKRSLAFVIVPTNTMQPAQENCASLKNSYDGC